MMIEGECMRKLKLSKEKDRSREYTHGYPRGNPRYDMRKPRKLDDSDFEDVEKDPDLEKDD